MKKKSGQALFNKLKSMGYKKSGGEGMYNYMYGGPNKPVPKMLTTMMNGGSMYPSDLEMMKKGGMVKKKAAKKAPYPYPAKSSIPQY